MYRLYAWCLQKEKTSQLQQLIHVYFSYIFLIWVKKNTFENETIHFSLKFQIFTITGTRKIQVIAKNHMQNNKTMEEISRKIKHF